MPASRFGPWQIRHSSFCGLVSAVVRTSQIEAPLVCMWSTAVAVSWQATQAAAIGEVTRVVPWAWHGAFRLQLATTPVHGCAVVQVHVAVLQLLLPPPASFWVKLTCTLLTA